VILNKEDFKAEDPSKDSENVAGEKNPIADKVINKEDLKESLKDENEKLVHGFVYPAKTEDPSKNSENEAGENKPNVEELTNKEDSKESQKDRKDSISKKDEDNGQLVKNPPLTNNKDQKIKMDEEQNVRTGKHLFNKNIYNAGLFKPHRPQGFYQPKSHPFYQYPTQFGYPGYPFGVPQQQYSSFYQPQQPYNSFLNYPLRNQQLYQPLANYQQNKPAGYPIPQKVQRYKPFFNYRQQKPIFPQQNKKKKQQQSVIRPNFRLNYPYLDDSLAVDDEFYFPKEDYEKEETVFAKDAETNDDGLETTEEEENKFIDSLTPQQINRLLDLLIESS